MKTFIHKLSDVQSISIGSGSTIWQFVVILKDAVIGRDCNINSHVFIENDVVIGDRVTVKAGVQIWDGLRIENDVFIGPNVTFTNDIVPRSKKYPQSFKKTLIKRGASIGANATIIAGNEIGEYSLVGAGSVVTKTVGKNELWIGQPATHRGYVTNEGEILDLYLISKKSGKRFYWSESKLIEEND
ncbi:N-acetyltransferase [Salinimicrobium sp. CDJ15-81-2]|nr:N-acetyltransferase [Salinimicrobium nanhaiense]